MNKIKNYFKFIEKIDDAKQFCQTTFNLSHFFLQFEPNNKRTNKYFKLYFALFQFLLLNLTESCILQCIFHYI